jgi:hypothetical protein
MNSAMMGNGPGPAIGSANPKYLRAVDYAVRAHGAVRQARKASTFPYVIHPIRVGDLLDRFGYPQYVVVAGVLHDLVEDTEVTAAEIAASFGRRVATLVEAASEPSKLAPWSEREARPWRERSTGGTRLRGSCPRRPRLVKAGKSRSASTCDGSSGRISPANKGSRSARLTGRTTTTQPSSVRTGPGRRQGSDASPSTMPAGASARTWTRSPMTISEVRADRYTGHANPHAMRNRYVQMMEGQMQVDAAALDEYLAGREDNVIVPLHREAFSA